MEWISGAISILFNQFFILLIGFVPLTLLLNQLLFNRRTHQYRSDFHRMKEQERESRAVLTHRDLLRDRTRHYEQSLTYAHRIQRAMFLTANQLYLLFPKSFIYHRSKEIVSGDFNWARKINGKMLFAVADCTGHGVPGAFLSLIDLALCSYDYNNRVLEYAGAFNSLYIVRDQTIIGIRPAIFSSS